MLRSDEPGCRFASSGLRRTAAARSIHGRNESARGGNDPAATPAHDGIDAPDAGHAVALAHAPHPAPALQHDGAANDLADRPAFYRGRPRLRERRELRRDLAPLWRRNAARGGDVAIGARLLRTARGDARARAGNLRCLAIRLGRGATTLAR